jgi:hypothetical protein
MGNEISIGEADLILEKLYSESVPVVAYYVRGGVEGTIARRARHALARRRTTEVQEP